MAEPIEDVLLGLTEAISVAAEQGDRETLDRLFADDFLLVTRHGAVWSKQDVLERWGSAPPADSIASHAFDDVKVRAFGDVGVVSAEITDRIDGPEGPTVIVERVFDVWQRRAGGWVVIASQSILDVPATDGDR